MLAAQRAQTQPAKKKVQGSTRGSEDRQTSVSTAAPRGQKRVRDYDLEKVSPCVQRPLSYSLERKSDHVTFECTDVA